MELFEEFVLAYLTKDKHVFVNPQYSIRDEVSGGEWSCPDFLVLNFKDKKVSVVEVSTGYDLKNLVEKVNNREIHWFNKLKKQLVRSGVIDNESHWDFAIQVFIRKERDKFFRQTIHSHDRVEVMSLEDLGFPWSKSWHVEQHNDTSSSKH